MGHCLFVHAARFSKNTKLFGRHNSLCILKTKSFEVTNPQNDFEFCFLENMFKIPVFQNKQITVSHLAFLARTVIGIKGKGKGKVTLFNVGSSFSYEAGINGSRRCALYPTPSVSAPVRGI